MYKLNVDPALNGSSCATLGAVICKQNGEVQLSSVSSSLQAFNSELLTSR